MSSTGYDDQFAPDPNVPSSEQADPVLDFARKRHLSLPLSAAWSALTQDAPRVTIDGTKGRLISDEDIARIAELLEGVDRVRSS